MKAVLHLLRLGNTRIVVYRFKENVLESNPVNIFAVGAQRFDVFKDADLFEDMVESIDELKERLSVMKKMMEERKAAGTGTKELFQGQATSLQGTTMIDGNFLSFVFGGSLFVIISVSVYAFYNLYHAVLKKFPSTHTEL
ncbi:hypothetical protein HW555_008269 [Spodoptera exigua]|uniref:Uncharacterized protein n=1 Tax=Spodoptera exigua TaxID=7107 RepID=A0A835GB97_SPOEX|nr:hypothetical protein HW555_008269 [Spodoptera exigua]